MLLLNPAAACDRAILANPDQLLKGVMAKDSLQKMEGTEAYSLLEAYPQTAALHLACAAHELPVSEELDFKYFDDSAAFSRMASEVLAPRTSSAGLHIYYAKSEEPWKAFTLRDMNDDTYEVCMPCPGGYRLLEIVEVQRAVTQLYPGAIFDHQGQRYNVLHRSWDTAAQRILVAEHLESLTKTSPSLTRLLTRVLETFSSKQVCDTWRISLVAAEGKISSLPTLIVCSHDRSDGLQSSAGPQRQTEERGHPVSAVGASTCSLTSRPLLTY